MPAVGGSLPPSSGRAPAASALLPPAAGGDGVGWAPAAVGASAPFPCQVTQSRQIEDVHPAAAPHHPPP